MSDTAAEHIVREVGEKIAADMSREMAVSMIIGPGPYFKQPWIERLLCWVSPYYRLRHAHLKECYEVWHAKKSEEILAWGAEEFTGFRDRYKDLES